MHAKLKSAGLFASVLAATFLCPEFNKNSFAAPGYTVVILNQPDGASGAYANGISPSGNQVVGYSQVNERPIFHAMLWNANGAIVGDLNPSGFTNSYIQYTNGDQQAGWGYAVNGPDHALLWSGTAASAVDLNPKGFNHSEADAISDGHEVGLGYGPATGGATKSIEHIGGSTGIRINVFFHALLWSGTAASAVDLNPPGFSSSGAYGMFGNQQVGAGSKIDFGINADNEINKHALLWSGTSDSFIDLNPKGFNESVALDISGNQEVGKGRGETTGIYYYHALLWTGTAASVVDLHPVGFFASYATATNGRQQVGTGSVRSSDEEYAPLLDRALLWSGTAKSCVDLQIFLPSYYNESDAYGIDANGDVIGTASNSKTHQSDAVEWIPVRTTTPPANANGKN
ncbi:MAG TPA: hypothetical protein VKJ65_07915 [Phycisphaerae bacterium]|nr:hypothetical protein [Phycisphaerae bacterium]